MSCSPAYARAPTISTTKRNKSTEVKLRAESLGFVNSVTPGKQMVWSRLTLDSVVVVMQLCEIEHELTAIRRRITGTSRGYVRALRSDCKQRRNFEERPLHYGTSYLHELSGLIGKMVDDFMCLLACLHCTYDQSLSDKTRFRCIKQRFATAQR